MHRGGLNGVCSFVSPWAFELSRTVDGGIVVDQIKLCRVSVCSCQSRVVRGCCESKKRIYFSFMFLVRAQEINFEFFGTICFR